MTEPTPGRWTRLHVRFSDVEENVCEEAAGDFAEQTGALGAAQTARTESGTEWMFFYPESAARADIESALHRLATDVFAFLPGQIGVAWRWDEVADENWALAWREFFQPIEIGNRFRIVPPWNAGGAEGKSGAIQIVIDPGQGFGTGQHETTRLALEALADLAGPNRSMLDVGSGSGILAIAAARLGASPVVAVEIDPEANPNALRNFQLNGVSDRIRLIEGGPEMLDAADAFDLVVCNMLLVNARRLFPLLTDLTAPGGSLVLSGFLTRETQDAKSVFPSGGAFESYAEAKEWGRLVWRKSSAAS